MDDGLRIRSLSFVDFRNHGSFSLEDVGDLTILIGRNAAGKTNALEGIQLLTSASSFRRPLISQLVREGAHYARLAMAVSDDSRYFTTKLLLEPGKKRYLVNGKAKGSADVRGILPSVLFSPDDLALVKKSSSVKRDALDDLGSQLNRSYYVARRDYEKTIRYKNRLLKDEASALLVESINESVITCGARLFCLRAALFKRMAPKIKANYAAIAHDDESFSATYIPSWDKLAEKDVPRHVDDFADDRQSGASLRPSEMRERFAEELERYEGEERRRQRSLVGPHNDQISFFLADRDAAAFASQGQQRSIVLAWKMAEVAIMREILEVNPVLLLDDVLSELDGSRRSMLVGFMTEDIQTFITATDLSGFDGTLVDRAAIVKLDD